MKLIISNLEYPHFVFNKMFEKYFDSVNIPLAYFCSLQKTKRRLEITNPGGFPCYSKEAVFEAIREILFRNDFKRNSFTSNREILINEDEIFRLQLMMNQEGYVVFS